MKRFTPGQKVVCTTKGWKVHTQTKQQVHNSDPHYNEIVTIRSYDPRIYFFGYVVYIVEYPDFGYAEREFEEYVSDEQLAKELASIHA